MPVSGCLPLSGHSIHNHTSLYRSLYSGSVTRKLAISRSNLSPNSRFEDADSLNSSRMLWIVVMAIGLDFLPVCASDCRRLRNFVRHYSHETVCFQELGVYGIRRQAKQRFLKQDALRREWWY